jgi:CheY-like chemotaxis protein
MSLADEPSARARHGHAAISPALTAAEALGDLPLAGAGVVDRARRTPLSPPVAAALRAALDWLSGEDGSRRPLELRAEGSVLEVICAAIDPEGLHAATEVLASVRGNLGPLRDDVAGGAWRLRVPALAVRPTYLMIDHAGVPLALPWHSVLRFTMGTPDDRTRLRAASDIPLLELSTQTPRGAGDVPMVLVGHGRKRGWLVADRLVWRLEADRLRTALPPPWQGLVEAVRPDGDDVYWIAEPEWLLESVATPPLPEAEFEPSLVEPDAMDEATSTIDFDWSEVESLTLEGEDEPAVAPATEDAVVERPNVIVDEVAPALLPPAPLELTIADVEPIAAAVEPGPAPERPALEPVARIEPPKLPEAPPQVDRRSSDRAPRRMEDRAPSPLVAPEVPPTVVAALASQRPSAAPPPQRPTAAPRPEPVVVTRPAPPDPTPAPLAALVAEDSLMARIFLTRMLEQQGLEVHAVETAAALREWLGKRAWALVCVDVDLPDARGAGFLRSLAAREGAHAPALVALVRDDQDLFEARAAGISRVLRKPFDPAALLDLLARAGISGGGR